MDPKRDMAAWTKGVSANDRFKETPQTRGYWVKGKNKEGKDRRWGPFKNSADAQEFKNSRKDIRSPQVVLETVAPSKIAELADKYTTEVYLDGGDKLSDDKLEASIKSFLKKNGVSYADLDKVYQGVYKQLGDIEYVHPGAYVNEYQ